MSRSLLSSLNVKKSSHPDTFLSTTLWKPYGARGVFGGHVIALALVASGKTISPEMGLHSQHCYFILPADPDITIEFRVDRLRDGRSYATRIVRAEQKGKAIFVLAASYASMPKGDVKGSLPFGFIPSTNGIQTESSSSKKEKGGQALSHSLRFAVDESKAQVNQQQQGHGKQEHAGVMEREVGGEGQVVPKTSQHDQEDRSGGIPPFTPSWHIPFPDGVSTYEESIEEEVRWKKFLETKGKGLEGKGKKYIQEYIQERTESPVSIAVAKRVPSHERNVRMIWLKARLQPDEKPTHEDIKVMIGYMTDFQFIGTAARSVGLTSASKPRLGMLATLDHTTHYYPFPPDLDANRPLLHVMEAAITDVNSGRGVVRGLVYTDKGVLIAVTSQEGVVRADLGGKGDKEKGVTEGGGFEGKAKL